MDKKLSTTVQMSSNRRHDKWVARALSHNFDPAVVVAGCSMWNAGYLPATIAQQLRRPEEKVAAILETCQGDLRRR